MPGRVVEGQCGAGTEATPAARGVPRASLCSECSAGLATARSCLVVPDRARAYSGSTVGFSLPGASWSRDTVVAASREASRLLSALATSGARRPAAGRNLVCSDEVAIRTVVAVPRAPEVDPEVLAAAPAAKAAPRTA